MMEIIVPFEEHEIIIVAAVIIIVAIILILGGFKEWKEHRRILAQLRGQ